MRPSVLFPPLICRREVLDAGINKSNHRGVASVNAVYGIHTVYSRITSTLEGGRPTLAGGRETLIGVRGRQTLASGRQRDANAVSYSAMIRWFIGDFTLTPQYFESSLSVNCHDSHSMQTYGP